MSLSAVQHCANSCSNGVQVCLDAHAMEVSRFGCSGETAVLGPVDSSHVHPILVVHSRKLFYCRETALGKTIFALGDFNRAILQVMLMFPDCDWL